MTLRAPFPWFGGKSRVASIIWERFGDVANYVEPFAGSLAVLLARPHKQQTETVNDRDAYLSNFWRAVQADPDAVWSNADQPVLEADLHARHVWLLSRDDFRERMLTDPHFYDVKIAGWWVWGLSLWIGDGWCAVCTTDRPTDRPTDPVAAVSQISRTRRPHRKIPELGSDRGIRRDSFRNWRVGAEFAPSVRPSVRPSLPDNCQPSATPGRESSRAIGGVFDDLAERLRDVRITCGDWSRVVTPSVTWRHGITGVLLDPPYAADGHAITYSGDSGDVSADVRKWAIENGDNPALRIALCGYADDHDMPASWSMVRWKAQGGYGSQGEGRGRENAERETIWFSPACLSARQPSLFEAAP